MKTYKRLKAMDLVLTPVHKSKNPNLDKKPKTKNGKWDFMIGQIKSCLKQIE